MFEGFVVMQGWNHIGIKSSEDYNRICEIGLNKDWSWVSLDNPRLLVNHDSRLVGRGWIVKVYNIKEYLNLVLDIFLWISLRIERLGIQEELPRGVLENISSYL